MVKSSVFKYVQQNIKYITKYYFIYIYIKYITKYYFIYLYIYKIYNKILFYLYIYFYIFYILLYIFKTTAFNHPPLFYISYSSRLVTFNITNIEFKMIH